jgi:isoquinoline 1-oxidoreductase beta subunit
LADHLDEGLAPQTAVLEIAAMHLNVNGKRREVTASDVQRPLVWYLRDRLALTGTKFGCGHGGCGACTVTVDGDAVHSCVVDVAAVAGHDVVTIEGLAATPGDPIFRAWQAEQVPQCGYCQPGMIMATSALLHANAAPSDADIDAALAHVLCRCGSYQRVRNAVHRAAAQDWDGAPFAAAALPPPPAEPQGERFRFNPWVTIAADGTVIVTVDRSEMGQGVNTTLAMLVAEELDVALPDVRTQFAPVDHVYDNPVIGMQITVGSMSVHNAWLPLRRAGADARERLIAAAADGWGVARAACRTRDGAVFHDAGNRRAGYGELAASAAARPPIEAPALKGFEQMRVLGKPAPRLEIPAHLAGRSCFGMDISLPGMLFATMLLPPVLGSVPERIDASAALAIDGVRDVFVIGDGIAIVAGDLWSAFRGRDALDVVWTRGRDDLSTAGIHTRLQSALQKTGTVDCETGDANAVFAAGATVIEAEYETPYVAHAPIEPINATVRIENGHVEVWVPTQGQTLARAAAAYAAGVPLDAVDVHTTFLGGGFGRRSVPDMITEAVQIALRTGTPIQLVWTRGDDIAHDRFRPTGLTMLRAALDAAGKPVALFARIAGPKLAFEGFTMPYDIPNVRVECVEEDPGIPTGYWRSVGSSQNAFAIEGFIDELAHAANADPVAFRLSLLGSSPRHRAVLERAAAEANWGTKVDGCSRGVAVYYAHGGWAAQIADVSVRADGSIEVHRVVCAVDCGFAVNPDTIAAQMEGGIAFGLTAALKSAITIEHGHVAQSGFRDFPLLTIAEMPRVEVHVVASREDPTGAGECGVPPIAPAVANAVFAATGRRIRRLPLVAG